MLSATPIASRERYAASGVSGRFTFMRFMKCLVGLMFFLPPAARADDPPKAEAPAKPRYERRREHDPNGIGKFYMGREIAQVMGHSAADWLDRPEREQEEQPKKLLPLLKLKPGDAVADIG